MSWLSDWLHPGRAYDKAQQASRDYYNQMMNTMQPYNQSGIAANDKLNQLYDALTNPSKLQDEWGKNYQESDYAKSLEKGAMDRGLNSASAMGLMGSSAAANNMQEEASDIMSKDRQQYMNDMMQKYLAGLGIATNQFNTGANMASQIGQNQMTQGQNEAGLEFGKANAGANRFGNIMDLLSQFGTNYLTGGFGQGSFGRGAFTPEYKMPNYYGSMMFLPPNR